MQRPLIGAGLVLAMTLASACSAPESKALLPTKLWKVDVPDQANTAFHSAVGKFAEAGGFQTTIQPLGFDQTFLIHLVRADLQITGNNTLDAVRKDDDGVLHYVIGLYKLKPEVTDTMIGSTSEGFVDAMNTVSGAIVRTEKID